MELEALLLGLEPVTALAIGVGALVLAPVVGAVGSLAGKDPAVGDSLAESSKALAKAGLIWSFDVFDKTQTFFAEAAESFQDLVAEARSDQAVAKAKGGSSAPHSAPHEVTLQ
jgi:hypothetical protein